MSGDHIPVTFNGVTFSVPRALDPVAAYIADNYGTCALRGACLCRRPGRPWMGRACRNWKPVAWRTFEEMRAALSKKQKEEQDGKEERPQGAAV